MFPTDDGWFRQITPGATVPLPSETPVNQIKAFLPHVYFHRTQNLTSSKKKKKYTIQNRPRIDPEILVIHSINPFTEKISTEEANILLTILCWTLTGGNNILTVYIYIYIYIYLEREVCVYIYIYIHLEQ